VINLKQKQSKTTRKRFLKKVFVGFVFHKQNFSIRFYCVARKRKQNFESNFELWYNTLIERKNTFEIWLFDK